MRRTLIPAAILVLTALLALPALAQTASQTKASPKSAPKASATPAPMLYVCSMCDVSADKPGKCPKCGMLLEAKPAEQTFYSCPMHPEVKAEKPGKCPKCGMNLAKKTTKVVYQYYCSMCPGVVSDKPGTCPKCGMFLEARPVVSKGTAASQAPAANTHAGHTH